MRLGEANAIFAEIENEEYTWQEKIEAIRRVVKMPTHNGVTKKEMLAVINWLTDGDIKKPEFDLGDTVYIDYEGEWLEEQVMSIAIGLNGGYEYGTGDTDFYSDDIGDWVFRSAEERAGKAV